MGRSLRSILGPWRVVARRDGFFGASVVVGCGAFAGCKIPHFAKQRLRLGMFTSFACRAPRLCRPARAWEGILTPGNIEVSTPGHIAQHFDSGLSELRSNGFGRHGNHPRSRPPQYVSGLILGDDPENCSFPG
jgi:hypothetical protein